MNAAKQQGAFSVVELLAVLAVLVTMLALLYPVFGKLWEMRHTARCAQNLRLFGQAVYLYAADHKLTLPPNKDSDDWFNLNSSWLTKYGGGSSVGALQKSLRCPADPTGPPATNYRYYYSYSINADLFLAYVNGVPAHGRAPVPLSKVLTKILFVDGLSHGEAPDIIDKYPYIMVPKNAAQRLSPRHQGKLNALFGDGSVRLMTKEEALRPELLARED